MSAAVRSPEGVDRGRAMNRARSRALHILSGRHYDEFQSVYLKELERAGLLPLLPAGRPRKEDRDGEGV